MEIFTTYIEFNLSVQILTLDHIYKIDGEGDGDMANKKEGTKGKTKEDSKVAITVFNPKEIKDKRVNAILNVLKAYENKPLTVEEIAYYTNLDSKTARKYLRLLRSQYPSDIVYLKTGVKLFYVYKPTKETLEELTLKVNKRSPKPRKALISLDIGDAELLQDLKDVDVKEVLKKVVDEIKRQKTNQKTNQQ
jgi:predicted DNA-binding transcriptional regulator YafY